MKEVSIHTQHHRNIVQQIDRSLKDTGSYPDTIRVQCIETLQKAPKLKQFLNSVFEGQIVAAWDNKGKFYKKHWDMSSVDAVIITKQGKIVYLDNSEWGSMQVCGKSYQMIKNGQEE